MTATIRIPAPLRGLAGGAREVEVDGATVGEALAELTRRHPGLRRHLYAEDGRPREFVNVFVGELDVRAAQGEATRLHGGETITIVPSIAGGASGRDQVSSPRPTISMSASALVDVARPGRSR